MEQKPWGSRLVGRVIGIVRIYVLDCFLLIHSFKFIIFGKLRTSYGSKRI